MKLSQILKEKTEIAHQQLEKVLIERLKSISSVDDYLKILSGFHGYIKPLEDRIDNNIDASILPDYNDRRKSAALRADLAHFNSSSYFALSSDVPAIQNPFEALGALYVLEGSTLGGQIISRMITQKLQLQENEGLSFFQSYGARTHTMWECFKAVLDVDVPAERYEAVVNAAEQTFIKFKTWLA